MRKTYGPSCIIRGSQEDLAERKSRKMDKQEQVAAYLNFLESRKKKEIKGNSRNP